MRKYSPSDSLCKCNEDRGTTAPVGASLNSDLGTPVHGNHEDRQRALIPKWIGTGNMFGYGDGSSQ